MQNRLDLYVPLIYFLAAVIYAWLGLFAWHKRPAVAVTPFAWAMLGMSVWSFTYGLEIFYPSLASKLLFTNIEYFGIVSVPVFLLIFSLEFIGKSHLLTKRGKFLLWSIPLLIVVLVWTNDYHHLMWDMESVNKVGGLALLNIRYGIFFWIQVAYSYIIVLVASLLLIIEMVQRPGTYRIQVSLIVIGILAPWVGTLIFIARVNPINDLDFTPLFFIPTGLGLSWAIIRFHLLEILPLEHLTVLKNMTDGVIVVNQHQRVLYINPIAEKLFGRTENGAIGQPLAYVSEIYGEKLMPYLTGTEQRVEIMIGEGRQATVFEATVSPIASHHSAQASSGSDSIITLHDITERKEMENALSRRESIMSAISFTAEQFLKETAWEHNVPNVLAKIGQAVDVSRVYVVMNHTDGKHIIYSSLCYEWAASGVESQINNPDLQQIPLEQAGFNRWEKELSNNLPIHGLIEDFPESEQDLFKLLGSISVAAMPIFVENQWWGFIMFDECRNKRYWTDIELKALRTTASIFGSAESRARAEQKLIRRQRALDLLHEIVKISLQEGNVKDMAQTVVDRLGELINADGCFLALWDETNKRTIPFVAYGPFKDTYATLSPQPGELTFTESVLKLGRTLIIEDTRTTTYSDTRIIKYFPSISLIVLPLMVMNRKLGSVLLSYDRLHRFQPEEISISEQASALIALTLEKFQAVEQAKKRADTSETLRRAGAVITEKLEMDQTISHILEQLNEVVPYDSASVQLLEDNELRIIGGHGWENMNEVIDMRFPVQGENPNRVVMETGKPYYLAETWKIYQQFKKPPHDHIRSWLGVPLIFQKKIIGLLAIDSSEPDHFTEHDIKAAAEFANQVAISLENARIFKETQDQANTDPLTGVYNRRGVFELAQVDFDRSVSQARPFSGIMIDLDNFKQVNDIYGHSVGDLVLQEFARRCRKCVRDMDYVGRYGGEEFIIILPETNIDTGKVVAERLRTVIAGKPMNVGEGLELNITASLGVAQRDENTTTLEILITRADQALYIAKHKGRNRVAVSV